MSAVLREANNCATLAPSETLSACEREVITLMRETVRAQRGRGTFIVEYVGSAWHVLVAYPPKHIKT